MSIVVSIQVAIVRRYASNCDRFKLTKELATIRIEFANTHLLVDEQGIEEEGHLIARSGMSDVTTVGATWCHRGRFESALEDEAHEALEGV